MVEIRKALVKDINHLHELMVEYIVDFYQRPKPADDKIQELITSLLSENEGIQFVAVQDERLIGFATLYFTYTTTRASKNTVMNDLYVLEEQRGKGVGEMLFNTCIDYSRKKGFSHMSWVTAADNIPAQKFYEKMGGKLGDWKNYSIE